MVDQEHSELVKLAAKILYVYSLKCGHCHYLFDYTVETADTDMISCYCGSAYSFDDQQLVIAALTTEEFNKGQLGRLDARINALLKKHDYKCYGYQTAAEETGTKRGRMICPCCRKSVLMHVQKGLSLKEYCTLHPNTLIVYADGTIRDLKSELGLF